MFCLSNLKAERKYYVHNKQLATIQCNTTTEQAVGWKHKQDETIKTNKDELICGE